MKTLHQQHNCNIYSKSQIYHTHCISVMNDAFDSVLIPPVLKQLVMLILLCLHSFSLSFLFSFSHLTSGLPSFQIFFLTDIPMYVLPFFIPVFPHYRFPTFLLDFLPSRIPSELASGIPSFLPSFLTSFSPDLQTLFPS